MSASKLSGSVNLDPQDAAAVAERKRVLGSETFSVAGRKFAYHVDGGNRPFDNERAVELPLVRQIVADYGDLASVIEVGNVLGHYFPIEHAVLDKFEHHRAVTWNEDVLEFEPPFAPGLIVSVSTLEHVGHVETPRDPSGFSRAVARLLGWLRPGGELVITVPLGYNPAVIELFENSDHPFSDVRALRRIDAFNRWAETSLPEVREAAYGHPFPCANALLVARAGSAEPRSEQRT